MIGFNKTVTIYNLWYDRDGREDRWVKTVLPNVSWLGHQKVSIGKGRASEDGYSVRILPDDMPKGFLERDEFAALPDPAGHWTAQNGDIVLFGEGPDADDAISEVTQKHTDCFTITAVGTDSLKRAFLPHLRLEGT